MEICPGIETGRNYYWKRSEGWTDNLGVHRWWEYFVEFCGWNGTGGVSIIKRSKWNGGDFMFCEPANLSREDSQKLIGEILLPAPAKSDYAAFANELAVYKFAPEEIPEADVKPDAPAEPKQ